jgi:uracil-DNA glycosylase
MLREHIVKFFGEEWVDFWAPFVQSSKFTAMMDALKKAAADGKVIYPAQTDIFRAFQVLPLSQVRVVMLGMDPYPTEGYANGLAFAHANNMKPTASMSKIVQAVETDCYNSMPGHMPPFKYDLQRWVNQGVLLLNSSLTVVKDDPGSHFEIWQPFTEYFCKTISSVKKHLIFVAIGKQAQGFMKDVDVFEHFIHYCEHPAAAARAGKEWECKAFSYTNTVITANKLGDKITW